MISMFEPHANTRENGSKNGLHGVVMDAVTPRKPAQIRRDALQQAAAGVAVPDLRARH
jgi:hypothetical protein